MDSVLKFSVLIRSIFSEYSAKLLDLQEAAKAAKKGKWAVEEESAQEHVRLKALTCNADEFIILLAQLDFMLVKFSITVYFALSYNHFILRSTQKKKMKQLYTLPGATCEMGHRKSTSSCRYIQTAKN